MITKCSFRTKIRQKSVGKFTIFNLLYYFLNRHDTMKNSKEVPGLKISEVQHPAVGKEDTGPNKLGLACLTRNVKEGVLKIAIERDLAREFDFVERMTKLA